MLLLTGLVAGAAGVVLVQERYLPPRLSPGESAALRGEFEQADAERQRLRDGLSQAERRLQAALSEKQALADDLTASRASAARLREDLSSIVASLPPDPRGGAVAVRAGRFTAEAGSLGYDIVLTRERAAGRPVVGTLQFLIAGESARGAPATVTAKPIALSGGSQEVVRGNLPLPDGFRPRQATIQVLDQPGGKPMGMRILLIP